MKFALQLAEETEAMQEIGTHLWPKPFSLCAQHKFKSDLYLECILHHFTTSAYKFSGTAPMGNREGDIDAVVDSNLR